MKIIKILKHQAWDLNGPLLDPYQQINLKVITMNLLKEYINDYLWWYKKQAPKYGYFRSIFDCWFNTMHFNRDGTYRKAQK